MRDGYQECVVIREWIRDDEGIFLDFARTPCIGEMILIDEGHAEVKRVYWQPVLSVIPEGRQQYYRPILYLEK